MRFNFIAVLLACLMVGVGLSFAPAIAQSSEPSESGASGSGADQAPAVIAVFKLDGVVLESPQAPDLFSLGQPQVSLLDLVRRIRAAGTDDAVKAIVILAEGARMGPAQIEEISQAISYARAKHKDVYVRADSMMTGQYMLASSATRISMVPNGDLMMLGLHMEQPYIRGLLDKIGVKPDFIHMGAYKSASELFMRDGPSPEADAMHNWLMDSLYKSIVDDIAQGRKVPADKVKSWIDQGLYTSEQAKTDGLIDAVEQRDALDQVLKKKYGENLTYDRRYGEPKRPQIDLSNPFALFKVIGEIMGGQKKSAAPGKPAVGIVYVDGMIVPGSKRPSLFGSSGVAYSDEIAKALKQAGDDGSIKAVVLRVDSPGGSATASEIILDACKRLKAKKPLVVSMGDVAGSGGYYVSLGTDTIFADSTTITASIGVVGGKIATTDMWKKIGITFKSYDRGKSADLLSSDNVWTDPQRQKVTAWMQSVYDAFKQHVMDARGQKLKKPLDDIAGGRVYTGKQALDLGLVDKIGTLQDAIDFAADRANLTREWDVRVVPQPQSPLEELIRQSSGEEENQDQHSLLGSDRPQLGSGSTPDLLSLAAPYLQHVDPERARAVRSVLMQLQLLGREGVIMAMPENAVFAQ
jgi:protease-4